MLCDSAVSSNFTEHFQSFTWQYQTDVKMLLKKTVVNFDLCEPRSIADAIALSRCCAFWRIL